MGEGDGNGHRKPLKFSFARTKPRLPRKRKEPDVVVEYVSVVDAGDGIVVRSPRAGSGVRVIPKLEDTRRDAKRTRDAVIEGDMVKAMEEMFEVVDVGAKPNVQYGLTLVEGRGEAARRKSVKGIEDEVFREELVKMPEELTLEEYEKLPVEEFGEALLRGMGWERGKPIGRNAKTVGTPHEGVRRQGRLGLGTVPAQAKAKAKAIRRKIF